MKQFYGLSGGVKIKLRIVGAMDAAVSFIPPGQYFNNGDFYSAAFIPNSLSANYAVANADLIAREGYLNFNDPFPLPKVESSMHSKSMGLTNFTGADVAEGRYQSLPMTELEFTVPNYNLLRFVGDATRVANPDSTGLRPYTSNMGILVVKVPPSAYINPGDFFKSTNVFMEVYVGANDETRLGFNVMSYPTAYAHYVAGGITYFLSPYNNSQDSGTASPRTNVFAVAPRAYFST
jgi:hypothetical protein